MKIALLGDTHFPDRDYGNAEYVAIRDHYFRLLFDAYFSVEADFYVQLGDLTNVGSEDEFATVWPLIRDYQKRFYFLYGNHDLYLSTKASILERTGQEDIIFFEEEGAAFLLLSSARELEHTRWGGFLDEAQLTLLKEKILATEGHPLFVFSHHGVFDSTERTNLHMHYMEPVDKVQEILDLRKSPAFFIQAHNHVDSIESFGPWNFIQLPAAYDDPTPRLLTIEEDAVEVREVPLESFIQLKGMAMRIAKTIDHFSPGKYAIGTTSQRNRRFPLR